MFKVFEKRFQPFRGRYIKRLTDFYGSNPTYKNPDFEDAEVERILRVERLKYWLRIFTYAGRKLREYARARVEVRVRKIAQWMHLKGSAMRAEEAWAKPLDNEETNQ